MEILTFFSFKGGVGRTQALLNTACEFAQRGKNVVLMDFDLHAPGLSLMECLQPSEQEAGEARPGTLDFFEWLVLLNDQVRRGEPIPDPVNLAACAYVPAIAAHLREGAGFFKLVPAAFLSHDCSDAPDYLARVHVIDSPLTEIIHRMHRDREKNPVIEQIRSQFSSRPDGERPDAVFIDARTGITAIADLLLTRSSDRIVLVTGLNQQNLWGLESTLQDIERSVETADWLRRITVVVSPVPAGEHELTGKRIKAITDTLNQHVDAREREMFGEIGLIPAPVEIPYDAQLALLEDPILLRHENSGPSIKYRELADRLGGKVEPLQFKEPAQEGRLALSEDGLPQEHPLARVPAWDAGLSAEESQEVIRRLTPKVQPDKPYEGWLIHFLNYLANSRVFSDSGVDVNERTLKSLPFLPLASRVELIENMREERVYLFSLPRGRWSLLAKWLGLRRIRWLQSIRRRQATASFSWRELTTESTSASGWGTYWTSMADVLRLLGRPQEAIALLTEGTLRMRGQSIFSGQAIYVLMKAGAYDEALSVADAWIEASAARSKDIAGALFWRGEVLFRLDRLDEARAHYEEALPIFREVKDGLGEANTHMVLGDLLVRTGELQTARAHSEEALRIFRVVKSPVDEANALQSLGFLSDRTGDLNEARIHFDKALQIFREVKDVLGEANTLRALGDLLSRTDELEEALAHFGEALPIFREVKDRLGEAGILWSLGNLMLRTARLDEARVQFEEALPIFRAFKSRLGEAITLHSLGAMLVNIGELDEARANYDEALAIYRQVKEPLGETNTLQGIARWYLAKGELAACQETVDDCLQRYAELSDPEGTWETQFISAKLHEAQGRKEEAREIAARVAKETGERGYLLLAREALEWLDSR